MLDLRVSACAWSNIVKLNEKYRIMKYILQNIGFVGFPFFLLCTKKALKTSSNLIIQLCFNKKSADFEPLGEGGMKETQQANARIQNSKTK